MQIRANGKPGEPGVCGAIEGFLEANRLGLWKPAGISRLFQWSTRWILSKTLGVATGKVPKERHFLGF